MGPMRVVVTGANGHLGSNLVPRLMAAGHEVTALVHRNADSLERMGADQVKGSVLSPETLQFAAADAVIHMAAKISIQGDPDGSVHRVNVEGTRNVARAARAADCRLVHVSSVHAFDLSAVHGTMDESSPRSGPGNYAYDRSKAAAEAAVREEVTAGLDATIVNPTGIIGPADFGPSRMGRFFLDLRDGRIPALVAGGFDWVDARDVADSIVAALTRGEPGDNHLLGGHFASVRQVATLASRHTGRRPPRMTVPLWLAVAGVPFASLNRRSEPGFTLESLGALRHGCPVDFSRAKAVLGHRPRPLAESVHDVYESFAAEGL